MDRTNGYWNHNVAYHDLIIRQVGAQDSVLDVGCGDGLLVSKLSPCCRKVVGIDADRRVIEKAKTRIADCGNASVMNVSFDDLDLEEGTVDVVIFVASIHHMDMEKALCKAKRLLAPHGRIIVVGLAKPDGVSDIIFDICRVIPAKLGSMLHKETGSDELGIPTAEVELSFRQIRELADRCLPGAKLTRRLYFRYLLIWSLR